MKNKFLIFGLFIILFINIINFGSSTCPGACVSGEADIDKCGYIDSSSGCPGGRTFQLTRNLNLSNSDCRGFCIRISGDNVVIDGKGHTIDCGGAGVPGIYLQMGGASSNANLNVTNVIFKNCGSGIFIEENRTSIWGFKNNTFISNIVGIRMGKLGDVSNNRIIIEGNTFNDNSGILMYSSINAVIKYNRFYPNKTGAVGIQLFNPINTTIERNNFSTQQNTLLSMKAIKISLNKMSSGNIIRYNNVSCLSNYTYDVECTSSSATVQLNAVDLLLSSGNMFKPTKILVCANGWPISGWHYSCCPPIPIPSCDGRCGDVPIPCGGTIYCGSCDRYCSQLSNTTCNKINITASRLLYPYLESVLLSIQDIPPQESDCAGVCGEFKPDLDKGGVPGNSSTCGILFYCGCKWSSPTCLQERGWRETKLNCVTDPDLFSCLSNCRTIVNSLGGNCTNPNDQYKIAWTVENESIGCESGEKIFPCPPKGVIPFFTGFSLIISIFVIIAIYYLSFKRTKNCKSIP